jgi:energy-coupling factor transporter ATP-binding protein EcfA2
MIKRIYINNYKNLVNFELFPGELTLLLGRNGTGKSAVLDTIHGLREVLSGAVKVTDPVAFPSRTLTRWQSKPLQAFELEVDLPETGPLTYRLEVEHEPDRGIARVALERLSGPGGPLVEFERGKVTLYRDDHTKGPDFTSDWTESWLARFTGNRDNPRPTRFLEFIRRMVVLRLQPQGIGAEARGEDTTLARDGANFAAWYRGMSQERPEAAQALGGDLARVIDGFTALRLPQVGQDTRAAVLAFDHDSTPFQIELDQVSDGQRALIVLYALLHFTAGQGGTLLLDEPDNYLALSEIQPWLMALSDACGDTVSQAVLCSHHPELIDYLGGEHGLLLERDRSGPVLVRSLADQETGGLTLSEILARGWER